MDSRANSGQRELRYQTLETTPTAKRTLTESATTRRLCVRCQHYGCHCQIEKCPSLSRRLPHLHPVAGAWLVEYVGRIVSPSPSLLRKFFTTVRTWPDFPGCPGPHTRRSKWSWVSTRPASTKSYSRNRYSRSVSCTGLPARYTQPLRLFHRNQGAPRQASLCLVPVTDKRPTPVMVQLAQC